jgi:CRP-like cAMP-binding protein
VNLQATPEGSGACLPKRLAVTDYLQNLVLKSLPAADLNLLRPLLKPVGLVHGTVLTEAGDVIHRVLFPSSGAISLVVSLSRGEMIEAAMIGYDGVLGGACALDSNIALNRAIVQLPGVSLSVDATDLRRLARQSEALRSTLMRHEQLLFAQAQQSAACNISHKIEARMARWLLRAHDLSGQDLLPLTQAFIAEMLCVQRTSVSLVAQALQHAGLVRCARGRIQIINMDGLRQVACECYATVKSHYDRLLNKGGYVGKQS